MNQTLSKFSRVDLCHQPTPLEAMPRLSEKLGGPNLWIKRDDCTGLATGGNKTRKLEFLVGQPEIQVCAFCFHRWQDQYSHHVLSINLALQAFQKAGAWPQVVSVDGKDQPLKILIMFDSFTLHILMMINQRQIV